jgi:hypothetical protein
MLQLPPAPGVLLFVDLLKRILGGLFAVAALVGGLLIAAVMALTGLVLLLFRGAGARRQFAPGQARSAEPRPQPRAPAVSGDVIDVVTTEVTVDRSKS